MNSIEIVAAHGIPQWYMDSIVNVDNDELIIRWEYIEDKDIHEGYCKFCDEAIYLENSGAISEEWEHMQSNHEAEISIYRLQTI